MTTSTNLNPSRLSLNASKQTTDYIRKQLLEAGYRDSNANVHLILVMVENAFKQQLKEEIDHMIIQLGEL